MVFERIFLPESTFIKKWSRLIFSLTAIFITIHTFVASFLVSFGCDGYGDNDVMKIVFGFWYIYDVLIVLDILIGLRTAVHHSKRGKKAKLPFYCHIIQASLPIKPVLPLYVIF